MLDDVLQRALDALNEMRGAPRAFALGPRRAPPVAPLPHTCHVRAGDPSGWAERVLKPMREYYHGPLFDMGDAPGQRQGSGRRAEGAWRGGDCRSYVGLACPPTLLTLPGHRFPSASRAQ